MKRLGTAHAVSAIAVLGAASALAGAVPTKPLPTATGFANDHVIPGYVHQAPSGSRGDIHTTARHDGTAWTVVFRRVLSTGDAVHDVVFVPGSTYAFQVATFDNADGSSTDASHVGDPTTVYTMTVPTVPGALSFSEVPAKLSALSGNLLANNVIEITATWPDATRSDLHGAWSFDGAGTWTQNTENEDRMAFIWDVQNDGFTSAGSCASTCHASGTSVATVAGTTLDNWEWKATQSSPTGFADDSYWDDGIGSGGNGLHADLGRSMWLDNDLVDFNPRYQSEGDPGAQAKYLFLFPAGMKEATPYVDAAWTEGTIVSGYVVRPPIGSNADVRSTASHDGSKWTVTLLRALNTGDPDHDIIFTRGGTFAFQVAIWDNSDDYKLDAVRHTATDITKVYTMTIPTTPGPLVFNATPFPLTSIGGKLLDSDEVEITVSWNDSTRNDIRGQWTYKNGAWTRNPRADSNYHDLDYSNDRVVFLWDRHYDNFASAGKCATMCHLDILRMHTNPGTVLDEWNWTATLAEASGYALDESFNDGSTKDGDGKNVVDPTFQTYSITNQTAAGVTPARPIFMPVQGAGTSALTLYADDPNSNGWNLAVPFTTPSASSTTTTSTSTTTTTSSSVTTTSTTAVPATTTTTLPCVRNPRCALDVATLGPACAGQVPAGITRKLGQAASFIDEAQTAPDKRARLLRRRATVRLSAAIKLTKKASRGRKPKLSSDCASTLMSAAGEQRTGLRTP